MFGNLTGVYNPAAVAITGGDIKGISRFELMKQTGQPGNNAYAGVLRPTGNLTGGCLVLGSCDGDGTTEPDAIPLVLQGRDNAKSASNAAYIEMYGGSATGRAILGVGSTTIRYLRLEAGGNLGLGSNSPSPVAKLVMHSGRALFGSNVDDGVSRVQITGAATISTTLSTGGLATLASASVTGNATVGGTLGVTGAITASAGINLATGQTLKVNGVQVVTARQAAIAAPAGGLTQDAEARTAINAIRAALTAHGLTA